MVAPTPRLVFGLAAARLAARAIASARACAMVTPARSRQMALNLSSPRSLKADSGSSPKVAPIVAGTQKSYCITGEVPRNPAGATPAIVSQCRLRRRDFPAMAGSEWK